MKHIRLQFLTEKGAKAHRAVEDEGKSRPWKERKISEKVCSDKIISNNPLIVQITIKIPWLAVQAELDKQIVTGLEKFGAVRDQDYTMEVQ